ncbi:molybdate ABC transporter substrate-binding protein [Undibacterium sp.]|uniref:molybdate ABC transporter substrate-binding protein n=1 Tax=Undibacterium sp. TaxID=1914977 RepID=UPI003752F140
MKSNTRESNVCGRDAKLLFVVMVLSFFCMGFSKADTLSVAVAANVQFAFDDLKEEFKKQTGHDLKGVFNSSGKFVSQITNGAPFDVFMSADMDYPTVLYQRGFSNAAPKIYAYGSLVLWTNKNIDLKLWQSLLQSEKIQKIAIANPKTAPYGRETIRALKHFKLDARLESRLIYAESISQVNQYIYSGLVDIGFTAKSVVVSTEMQTTGKWIDLPLESYTPIAQGVIILKHGRDNSPKLAQQFYDFLSTAKAKAIFQKNGYAIP